jgi:hypothetical protein
MVLVLSLDLSSKIFRASCRTCAMGERVTQSLWIVARPAARRLSGTRSSRNYGPNRSIGWNTPDCRVEHAGIVRFDAHPMRPPGIDIRIMNGGGTVSGYREQRKAAQAKNPSWIRGELREELASCVSQILLKHSARPNLRNSRSQRSCFFCCLFRPTMASSSAHIDVFNFRSGGIL